MELITWKPVNATVSRQIGSTSKKVAVTGVIVNSHTSGTFRFANGTSTNYTPIGGTYTPAAGSSTLMFEPIDFDSGCYMVIAGTFDGLVLMRERDEITL